MRVLEAVFMRRGVDEYGIGSVQVDKERMNELFTIV